MKKWLKILFLLLLILGGYGCRGALVEPTPVVREVQVVLVNSEITLGQTRFAVALLDEAQQFVDDAVVEFEYFDLSDGENPVFESSTTAVLRQSADQSTAIYTHRRTFARAGNWGVQLLATFADGAIAHSAISFVVTDEPRAFPVGQLAPEVKTPTGESVDGDLSQISTAVSPHPDFYALSFDEALKNGRPTLIYFSTPAFCQTRLCAPGYDELVAFHAEAGSEVDFIHVEVFKGLPDPSASGWPLADGMYAFGLSSEPWLYLVDGEGMVLYRIEGLFTAVELAETLTQLLP